MVPCSSIAEIPARRLLYAAICSDTAAICSIRLAMFREFAGTGLIWRAVAALGRQQLAAAEQELRLEEHDQPVVQLGD